MKKVFLMESNPLMLKAWEERLKDSSWELYALDDINDFSFRLKDFEADFVVIASSVWEEAINQTTDIPCVLLGNSEGLATEKMAVHMKHPIDIANLEDLLGDILTQVS